MRRRPDCRPGPARRLPVRHAGSRPGGGGYAPAAEPGPHETFRRQAELHEDLDGPGPPDEPDGELDPDEPDGPDIRQPNRPGNLDVAAELGKTLAKHDQAVADEAEAKRARKRESDRRYAEKNRQAKLLARAVGNPVESSGQPAGPIEREPVIAGPTKPVERLAPAVAETRPWVMTNGADRTLIVYAVDQGESAPVPGPPLPRTELGSLRWRRRDRRPGPIEEDETACIRPVGRDLYFV